MGYLRPGSSDSVMGARCRGLDALFGDDNGMLSGGGGGGMSALPVLDLGKVVDHSIEQPALEAGAEKVVKDGVDNTVEHGEAVDDVVEEVEQVGQVAVEGDVGPVQCDQQQGHMVGQPADDKDSYVGAHQPAVAPALRLSCLPQPAGGQHVEHHHEREGQQEAQDSGGQGRHQGPRAVRFKRCHEEAHGLKAVHQLDVDHLRQRDEGCEDPDPHAHSPSSSVLVALPGWKGVGECDVAVDAEAHQEEDTAVHVDEIEVVSEAAGEAAPEPGVVQRDLQHPHGQRQDDAQVCDGHVEDVGAQQACAVRAVPVDADHQKVLHQPDDEDGQVEHEEGHSLGVLAELHVALRQGVIEEVEQFGPVVDLSQVAGRPHAGPRGGHEDQQVSGGKKGGLEEKGGLESSHLSPSW